MSRSQSLNRALEAAARVMLSEESDLRELSKIAGIPPETLFAHADLSGINLLGKDIGFLGDLPVEFEAATLSDDQRRALRRNKRAFRKKVNQAKSEDGLIQKIHDFVSECERIGQPWLVERIRKNEPLRSVLLDPLLKSKVTGALFSSDYTNRTLREFEVVLYPRENGEFFRRLFTLLGELRCEADNETIEIIERYRAASSEDFVGIMLAAFHPTEVLDAYWIDSSSAQDRAKKISDTREIHPSAVEKAVYNISGAVEVIRFLSACNFSCDGDRAERIAATISNSQWPSEKTSSFLSARINYRVSSALFRQLLTQAEPARIVEIIKWLEDDRGAAGALSLENAFSKIDDFDLAFGVARSISDRLAENQISVVRAALQNLAYRTSDSDRVKSLFFRR